MSFNHLSSSLASLRERHHFRQTRFVEGGNNTSLIFDNKPFINFSSNDYLGLATDPDVIKASNEATTAYGVGSGGSSLVTGHSARHEYLQSLICDVTQMESCLLFTSGFSANSGVISTLLSEHDLLIQDKLNHASLMDAGIHSNATMKRFMHNDMTRLAQLLEKSEQTDNRLVVTEGVFSMDGDSGDLHGINQLQQQHKSWLMVDDAHGFGINGDGRGSCYEADVKPNLLMATFGKAIGTSGAFVAASCETVDYLTNFCRHYIYSTALPMPIVAATIKSIELSQQQWRREKLNERIIHFREKAEQQSLTLMPSNSAIQPIIIGDSSNALKVSQYLKEHGFWVSAIRPPTVPQNTARLRVTLSANHQLTDIDNLITHLVRGLELLAKGDL